MRAARSVEVAFIGRAVRVGDHVILVGVDGLAAAARRGARLRACADEMPQLAAGDIAQFGVLVIAGALGDPLKGARRHAQVREELPDEGTLARGTWQRVRSFRFPGMASRGAGVGDCLTSLVDDYL